MAKNLLMTRKRRKEILRLFLLNREKEGGAFKMTEAIRLWDASLTKDEAFRMASKIQNAAEFKDLRAEVQREIDGVAADEISPDDSNEESAAQAEGMMSHRVMSEAQRLLRSLEGMDEHDIGFEELKERSAVLAKLSDVVRRFSIAGVTVAGKSYLISLASRNWCEPSAGGEEPIHLATASALGMERGVDGKWRLKTANESRGVNECRPGECVRARHMAGLTVIFSAAGGNL